MSDADRDAVAASLARHVAAGRLTMEEYTERLDECFRARTAGALRAVLRELPDERPRSVAPALPSSTTPVPGSGGGPGRPIGVPLLPVLVLLVLASAALHAPLFLLVFPAMFLTRRGPRGGCGRGGWNRTGVPKTHG